MTLSSKVRVLYATVQIALLSLGLYVLKRVQGKNDQTPLRYQEAQAPFSQE